jgi:hypothetical protein
MQFHQLPQSFSCISSWHTPAHMLRGRYTYFEAVAKLPFETANTLWAAIFGRGDASSFSLILRDLWQCETLVLASGFSEPLAKTMRPAF